MCGEVKRPVLKPPNCKADAVFSATEPLPFVPAMWMEGNAFSGLPNSSVKRAIELRVSSARMWRGADPAGPLCLKTFCRKILWTVD